MQQGDEFVPYAFDHLSGGCTRCGEFRDVVDETDEVRFLDCRRMVITVAGGKLCHDDPDHEETHGSLDVRPVGDGKLLVGAGEEEVEPHGGRDRGHEPGEAVAQSRDRHDDRDEDQRGCGVGEARAEWDEDGCHPER